MVALVWISLAWHATPLYGVETDLLGEYIPAARDIAAGSMQAVHYQFHGFGYPLLLAGAAPLVGGDYWLAARLLEVAAAAGGAAAVWALVAGFLGPMAGLIALLALLVNPVFVRATLEAGTDLPCFALAIGATALLLRGRGPRLALAGALAGLAVTCRYDSVTLLAAAAIVLLARRARWPDLAAYAGGAAVPLGAWLIACRAMHGDPFGRLNYMNVAYELVGNGLPWDTFWSQVGARYHSLGDVLLDRPRETLTHLVGNLALRWWRDSRELMPPVLGALAVPGMLLAWRRPGWRGMVLHFGLAYLVLALVFYSPRFSLYLLPFYLAGVAGLLTLDRLPFTAATRAGSRWVPRARAGVTVALLAVSAVSTVVDVRRLLADPPDEVRLAAAELRSHGLEGAALMARKPHTAYFAHMRHVALPDVDSFEELIRAGREAGAQVLFFSRIEAGMRLQFSVLAEPGVNLPGLLQLEYHNGGPRHSYTLYRFTDEATDERAFTDSVLVVIGRSIRNRPDAMWPRTYLAGYLLDRGRPREALDQLTAAERLAPQDAVIARMQTVALTALGDYEGAANACQRAVALGGRSAWTEANLGHARLLQGRYAEARERLTAAVRLDPTNARYAHALGLACFRAGDAAGAIAALEHLLASRPDDDEARVIAAHAHVRLGDVSGALRLLEVAPGARDPSALRALADSLRRHTPANRGPQP